MEPLAVHFAPQAEYRAARTGCALFDGNERAFLRVTGSERASYLHGMVTNDVEGLPERGLCYAALLTAKGAMVADAHVLRRPDELLVELEPGLGPKVLDFLGRYLISEDAELADVSAEHAVLELAGPGASSVLTALALPWPQDGRWGDALLDGQRCWVLPSALWGVSGARLVVPRPSLAAVRARVLAAGAVACSTATREVVRVEAGVPRYGSDMDDATLPLEAGLERAIHYQKGCYIGQEVVARATYRGQVARRLWGLLLGERSFPARTELSLAGRKVGFLTSQVFSPARGQNVALGYLHRDAQADGTLLDAAGEVGVARSCALPLGPTEDSGAPRPAR